ncbi:MAG TPA: helix-turn-helix domain-containing protein [Myxococcaceae bacterium]|nr:helix-turn-helix domain-containing protein [Myxococcaceae bacterium]
MENDGGRGHKGELLLAAAKRCFLMHGYRRTSIDDVAQEAGVAKGTVYLYFKSKEEIFRAVSSAVIRKYLGDAEKAASSPGTVEERLAGALEAKVLTVHALKSSAHGQELVDSSHTVSGDIFEASYSAFVKILEKILEDADLSMPASEAAWLVFRAAHSAGFSPAPPPPDVAEVQRRIRALAEVLVRGLTDPVSSRPRAAARARPSAAARTS